jgi:hypothetical protein
MIKLEGNVLEIHEVFPEYYNKIKEFEGTLTFDDGLYSQYIFLKNNPELCFRSIVFVSPACIRDVGKDPIKSVVLCDTAHFMYSALNDNSAYMSLSEIQELKSLGVIIGYHGYFHYCYLNSDLSPVVILKTIDHEVQTCLDFQSKFNLFSNIFCAPYNDYKALNFYVKSLEHKTGQEFAYVKDRISFEELNNLYINNRYMYLIKPSL